MNDHDGIANLLNQSEDDLYIEIGKQLIGQPAFPPSPQQLGEVARKWLNNKRTEIAKIICHAELVTQLTSEDSTIQNRILLVSAIADLITSLIHGVSPVTVSVLLIKEGLNDLCRDI